MLELTTYTELEIAHRLMAAYTQKCRSLHGHRYQVEITVTAQKLNDDGMIVDFKKLKEVVKTVLDDKWDHGSCFNIKDPLGKATTASGSERVHIIDGNPTLEWMVERWASDIQEALDKECPGVAVSMLKASETARNTVTWHAPVLPWDKVQPADKDECVPLEKPAPMRLKKLPPVSSDVLTPCCDDEANPDASIYLVVFRGDYGQYSTTIRTALRGKALLQEALGAAIAMIGKNATLLGITKIPG
jgi:6-pyruvoyltetrahydropterin/6-carboxytetrahydropterin synthase